MSNLEAAALGRLPLCLGVLWIGLAALFHRRFTAPAVLACYPTAQCRHWALWVGGDRVDRAERIEKAVELFLQGYH